VKRTRILIVEDEVRLRRALVTYFERCGLEVAQAGSLQEARERLDLERFDAVILDVGLPDGDGLSLLPSTDARHSVVVSAHPDPQRFADCGVVHHLPKPVDLRELRSVVEAAAAA
jgi:DNA-binding response OmpR family regulator